MGRPAGWMSKLTGRGAMRSPGAQSHRRETERRFWEQIATGITSEKAAEAVGADGLLLLPPYLVGSEQDGLAAHVEAVCRATKLGVIFYNRANAQLNEYTLARLCERCRNLVVITHPLINFERPIASVSWRAYQISRS